MRSWLSSSSSRRCSPTARRPFAYAGELRGPGLAGRLATWGVRLGWLAQTALLVGQAASAEGFPWGTWAGALNLFVWLVVGAYLIWGCTPRYRLLGLAVMPVAVVAARARVGRRRHGRRARATRSGAVLAVHAGLMLAGFAGLTARRRHGGPLPLAGAAAEAARAQRPARARAAARRARPAGGAHGARLARRCSRSGSASARRASSAATSTLRWPSRSRSGRSTPPLLVLRHEGWRGRRAALLNLAGFALVAIVLPDHPLRS